MPTTPGTNPTKSMKLFGQDSRVVLTVVALFMFFAIGISGVLIAQRQRQVEGPVAPTAPESEPAAYIQQQHTCSVALFVPNPPSPTPSTSPSPSPRISPSPSLIPSPSPVVYSCNSTCSTTAQCQTANVNYVCTGGRCRMNGNTASTTCQYKCDSSCSSDTECKTIGNEYMCYQGKCRMSGNPTSPTCQYNCPVIGTRPPTNTCAPTQSDTGTITWQWNPISGHNNTTQYQIQTLDMNNNVVGEDKGCKPGDEYYNCFQGTCQYTSYHLPGTYKARIKACTSSCPAGTTQGYTTTANRTITVCQ